MRAINGEVEGLQGQVMALATDKIVLLGVGFVVLVLFGDTVFSVLWMVLGFFIHSIETALHLALEWVEIGVEHFYEHTFHLSTRGSQLATAYTGLFVAIVLVVKLIQELRSAWRHGLVGLGALCDAIRDEVWTTWRNESKSKIVIVASVVGMTLYFLAF